MSIDQAVSALATKVRDLESRGVDLDSLGSDEQEPDEASRRADEPSAAAPGGESRREFHTDRMSEEERRELAATDEVWGEYVESKKVRPESEL